MKKKIFVLGLVLFFALNLSAQKINGVYTNPGVASGAYYTTVNWEISYSFYASNGQVFIKWANPVLSVAPNATYYYYGKYLTKEELGISSWPAQLQKPHVLNIEVSGKHSGGNFESMVFCQADFTCTEYAITGINAKDVNIETFKVTAVNKMQYNAGGDAELENIIRQKQSKQSVSNTAEKSNSTALLIGGVSNQAVTNGVDTSKITTTENLLYTGVTSLMNSKDKAAFQGSYQQGQALSGLIDAFSGNTASANSDEQMVNGLASLMNSKDKAAFLGGYQQGQDINNAVTGVSNIVSGNASVGDVLTTYNAVNSLVGGSGGALSKTLQQGSATTALVGAAIDLFGESAAKKEARLKAEQEAAQRQQMLINRKNYINGIKDTAMPLSSQLKDVDQIYFFAVSFDQAMIDIRPVISVTNVFPVARYSDGTWPYAKTIKDDLIKLNTNNSNIKMVGYHTTKAMIDKAFQDFCNQLSVYGFTINTFNYTGKGSVSPGNASVDFWGNSTKPTATKKESATDFWGNPTTGTTTTKSQEPTKASEPTQTKKSPAPALDEWGMPIKKTKAASATTTVSADTKTSTPKTSASNPVSSSSLDYSDWMFIQSDKALQYRMARVKEEAGSVYVQFQVRLNKQDDIFCKSDDCKGYIWYYNFATNDGAVKIESHTIFKNSFDGIYTYDKIIPVPIQKKAGEFENFWDTSDKRFKYKDLKSGEIRTVTLGWSCVDNELGSSSSNRCREFKVETAKILK